ncbi:hypothetical protein B4N89_45640 [Embleya scabrispora]|uniref:RNase H type-1 domain-containing protein n=1 Tax=Embleya scabrispora TaxID=159449 RepID=A0A1T3NIW4_9ACTN|nr:hypothetical protein B4N89_45640 [Embleya scabrispora]
MDDDMRVTASRPMAWDLLVDPTTWKRLSDVVPAGVVRHRIATMIRTHRLRLNARLVRNAGDERVLRHKAGVPDLAQAALGLMSEQAMEQASGCDPNDLGWCVDASSGPQQSGVPHVALVPMNTTGRVRAHTIPVPADVAHEDAVSMELFALTLGASYALGDTAQPLRWGVFTDSKAAAAQFERARAGLPLHPRVAASVRTLAEALAPAARSVSVRWVARNSTPWMTFADAASKAASGTRLHPLWIPTTHHTFSVEQTLAAWTAKWAT